MAKTMSKIRHPFLLVLYWPIIFLPILGIIDRANFSLCFLCVLLFNIIILLDMKDRRAYFFSPTFITILYLYLSFFFGEILFYNEIYKLNISQVEYYETWKYLPWNVFYYNVCTFLMILSYLFSSPSQIFRNHSYHEYT